MKPKISILIVLALLMVALFMRGKNARAAMASCSAVDIVLNEVAYDDDGGDDQEFVELLFPNGVAANELENCEIHNLNQTQTIQATLDLSAIDDSGFNAGDLHLWNVPSGSLQNGENDGIALVDTNADSSRWYYTWETTVVNNYKGMDSVDLGEDTGAFCDDGTGTTETSISKASGTTYVEGACATPGAANQGPTNLSMSQASATFVDRMALFLGLAIGLTMMTGWLFWQRRHSIK